MLFEFVYIIKVDEAQNQPNFLLQLHHPCIERKAMGCVSSGDVSVRIINELGRTIGYSISRALHAAGIPHGDDLFFATWGNSLDAIESEIAAARFLGGRLRGDVAEHEPMDRCLYNGQMRPGALGPPASWHDESDDVGTTFNNNNKQ